jgi:Protein of unknown function (DUF3987)
MTSWSGNSGYTFDRIGRGSTRVKRICLSLVGGATPDTITKYINDIDRAGGIDPRQTIPAKIAYQRRIPSEANRDLSVNTSEEEAEEDLDFSAEE